MPLLRLETTGPVPEDRRQELLASLSKIVAETLGKPEQYVMVTISPAAVMMSGREGPAAFADVRSIGGFSAEANRRLSQQVCQLLAQALAIPPSRVYLTFTNVAADHWGWNGETFG